MVRSDAAKRKTTAKSAPSVRRIKQQQSTSTQSKSTKEKRRRQKRDDDDNDRKSRKVRKTSQRQGPKTRTVFPKNFLPSSTVAIDAGRTGCSTTTVQQYKSELLTALQTAFDVRMPTTYDALETVTNVACLLIRDAAVSAHHDGRRVVEQSDVQQAADRHGMSRFTRFDTETISSSRRLDSLPVCSSVSLQHQAGQTTPAGHHRFLSSRYRDNALKNALQSLTEEHNDRGESPAGGDQQRESEEEQCLVTSPRLFRQFAKCCLIKTFVSEKRQTDERKQQPGRTSSSSPWQDTTRRRVQRGTTERADSWSSSLLHSKWTDSALSLLQVLVERHAFVNVASARVISLSRVCTTALHGCPASVARGRQLTEEDFRIASTLYRP